MRINQQATLTSVPSTLGDKNPPKYVRGGAVLLEKLPNQALPNTLNLWDRPIYQTPKKEYVRPGANDFLNVKSVGVRT